MGVNPLESDSKSQNNPAVETEIIGTVIDNQSAQYSPLQTTLDLPGFRTIAMLGRGGMGCVYLAEHLRLSRKVALKIVANASTASEKLLARFQDEARAVAAVTHSGVCQIYEVGEANGLPYLAMEYIEGETLSETIRRQLPTTNETARYVRDIAVALEACHQAGILHRDLKPANVMLSKEQVIKVMDFGLAKRLDSQDGSHTKTGEIIGTPSYMAPEQASGITKQFTPATDVYAIGTILYECLTGRPPFQTPDAMQTVMMVLTEDPISPRKLQPKVPVDLETICLKSLQKKPAKRYQSAAELADDIQRFLDNEPILARKTPVWEQAWKWIRRHPTYTTLATMIVLAIMGAVIGTSLHVERLQVELDRSERLFDGSQDLGQWLVDEHIPEIARIRGGTEQQKQLVDRTLKHLQELEKDIAADAQLAQYIAQAYRRIAEVQANPFFATDSRREQALESYENSLRIYEDLESITTGDSKNLQFDRIEVLIEMARLHLQLKRYQQVLVLTYEAQRHLPKTRMQSPRFKFIRLSLSELNTAVGYENNAMSPEIALSDYVSTYNNIPSEGILFSIAKRHKILARLLLRETEILANMIKQDELDSELLRLRTTLEEFATADNLDQPSVWMIAQAQANLAYLIHEAGNSSEADRVLESSIEKQQRLVNEYSESTILTRSLLAVLKQKIEAEIAKPDLEQAFVTTQRHMGTAQDLYLSAPDQFRTEYLESLQLLSDVQRQRLRFDEAQDALNSAIHILKDSTEKKEQLFLAELYVTNAELMVEAVRVRSIAPERIASLQNAIDTIHSGLSILEKHGEATESEPGSPYWQAIARLHEYEEERERLLLLSRESGRSVQGANLPQLIGPADEDGK